MGFWDFGVGINFQIFKYNESALVVMVGKNYFTIVTDFQMIYRIHDKVFLDLSRLANDGQTLFGLFSFFNFWVFGCPFIVLIG